MGFDGFDSIELVMGLEDRLGITIPDRDAERLRTPGDAVDYLAGRMRLSATPADVRCRSAAAFRLGRRRLAATFDLPAAGLRPTTPTNVLLPKPADVAARRKAWSRLSRTLGVPLPGLRHSARYSAVAAAVGLITFACSVCLSYHQRPTTLWTTVADALMATALTFGLPALLLFITRGWLAVNLPCGYETVGAVVSDLTVHTIPSAPALPAGWTRHELWEMVRDLTAASAGCPPSNIKRDGRWPV